MKQKQFGCMQIGQQEKVITISFFKFCPNFCWKDAQKNTDIYFWCLLNPFQWQDKEITCLIDSKGDLPFWARCHSNYVYSNWKQGFLESEITFRIFFLNNASGSNVDHKHFHLSKCIGKLNEKWSLVRTMPQGKKQLTLDFPVQP